VNDSIVMLNLQLSKTITVPFKYHIIILTFLTTTYVYSQDMQNGFNYLETGKY